MIKIISTLAFFVATGAFAQPYVFYPSPPPPPVIVQPPAVLVPIEPRCHHERVTVHDDILDTDNWTDREVCD